MLEARLAAQEEKLQDERQRTRQADAITAQAQSATAALQTDIARLEAELKSKADSKRAAVAELKEKLTQSEQQAKHIDSALQQALTENRRMTDQLKSTSADKQQLDYLEQKVADYKKAKFKLTVELEGERAGTARLQGELEAARGSSASMEGVNSQLTAQVKALASRVRRLNEIIVELKGSIRVFCRVRPVAYTEDCRKADIDELVRYPDYNQIDFKKTMFEFDQVYGPGSTQEEVYEEVEPFVRSAMGGLRVCIFA